jgi:5-methylthioadenosine/S-adenosylhomocysteine deaminase
MGAARVLGLDREIGSLEPGKKADFVLFGLDHSEWVPYRDPVQALVWSATSASIRQTWVDGRPVLVDGALTTLPDESELRAEARARADRLIRAAGLDAGDVPLTTTLYQ